jgi:uncharacterized membrane protein
MSRVDELTQTSGENRAGYWGGFAAGALIGTAAAVAGYMMFNATKKNRDSRVIRLEDSIQIGKPVGEVFTAWADFEQLPRLLKMVNNVHVNGNYSEWDVTVDGKDFAWAAETVQFIPNEAIGWRSVKGPKHSGRITFSSVGNDTVVHVTMNYAPPLGRFSRLLSAFDDHLESYIGEALRDFKSAIEFGETEREASVPPTFGAAKVPWTGKGERKSTGTEGNTSKANPVRYTRPPKDPYP